MLMLLQIIAVEQFYTKNGFLQVEFQRQQKNGHHNIAVNGSSCMKIDINGALFTLSLSASMMNSQHKEGARDVNVLRSIKIISVTKINRF